MSAPPVPPAPRLITLLTDFGRSDTYVGVMKGVIATIAPEARVIDLVHDVPAQDTRAGAFHLMAAYRYFPAGTIHVAVVDPGVGTARAIVAVRAGDYTFLGPDNGVLRWAVDDAGVESIVRVESADHRLPDVSATFHGRDVIAPAAAHLARGLPLESLGPPAGILQGAPFPRPDGGRGVVIHVDRFGNCITNLTIPTAPTALPGAHVEVLGRRLRVVRTYGDMAAGEAAALVGSAGRFEIAVNGGSAAEQLGIGVGSPVRGSGD